MRVFRFKASDLPVSLEEFRLRALSWAASHLYATYYNPNQIPYPHDGFAHLLAVSNAAPLPLNLSHTYASLREQLRQNSRLLCGYWGYDLKNQTEQLHSHNPDQLGFPPAFFFAPQVYLYFHSDSIELYISESNASDVVVRILASPLPAAASPGSFSMRQRVSRETYEANVARIRHHIAAGDVYELNYCMEFFAENIRLSPLPLYLALNEVSPTPFSGFMKCGDKYLLCASPERFLKKMGRRLVSQPIKGTIRRGATTTEDARLQHQLRHDEKELAENMMIVDLVRNDLSRCCATGTVQVTEMFGIYGFRQVSQMISTVEGSLRPEKDLVDALQSTFPMGSMTGAPKISAMRLIEELEDTKRGLYSGAFGYITPEQDADFNVVIRSLQYDAQSGYLSFMVGSAITYDSDPDQEYQECLLKAKAMLQVLGCRTI